MIDDVKSKSIGLYDFLKKASYMSYERNVRKNLDAAASKPDTEYNSSSESVCSDTTNSSSTSESEMNIF